MSDEEREAAWLRVLSLPRQQRRAAARRLAWQALSVPSGTGLADDTRNRATARAEVQGVRQAVSKQLVKVSARRQRIALKAERDRRRYARLSDKRREALEEAKVAAAILEEVEDHDSALD